MNSRSREFQAGAVFSRVLPPIPPGVGRPGVTSEVGTQPVKLSTLAASQKRLDPARVQHYVKNPGDPITVLQTHAGRVIYDGHHRAAAAKKRGEKTIMADVRAW